MTRLSSPATGADSIACTPLSWLGVSASVTHRSREDAHREELSCGQDSLYVSLEEVGGRTAVSRSASLRMPIASPPQHASFLAAGEDGWEVSEPIRLHRRVRIAFDGDEAGGTRVKLCSRFMFADPAVLTCARLLAAECEAGARSGSLYGAAVVMALTDAIVQAATGDRPGPTRGLLPWQLRKAKDHLEAHLAETVAMADLARLTGLSESYFGRAFKASTGLPPHRWHLRLKVERCQELLMDPVKSLAEIAAETGFADQSHLTRIFRSFVGIPPAVWRRQRSG